MSSSSVLNYSECSKTINIFPQYVFDEDLMPDCGVEIDAICTEIHEACKGWGKDSNRLIKAIGNTVAEDRFKIALRYPELYSKSLTKLMKHECGNSDFGVATQFLSVGPVEAECMMLKKAMDGMGSDTTVLYSILCGRSNEDMVLLKKTYFKMYTEDLVARMSSEWLSGDLKATLLSSTQAAEEEFNPDYHTDEKAAKDAEILYKVGQGRWGTDGSAMVKIVVLSPPKYLKMINAVYCDKYGYTLMKAFEKELNKKGGDAAKFTVGMKLKPYDTIATLIKKSCKGLGTRELLLTSCIIRYQDLMGHVYFAHEDLFEKGIHKRIRDETSGEYKKLLLALLNKICPE